MKVINLIFLLLTVACLSVGAAENATLADAAGIPVPGEADGKSFYPLFSNQKQEPRETFFMHYDPLKKATEKWYGLMWYGRFVRDKTYKLYDDGRFYNVSADSLEQDPIPDNRLTEKEMLLKRNSKSNWTVLLPMTLSGNNDITNTQ